MSREAVDLVWKRSRAKGSNLLTVLVIANCADPEGRNAFPYPKYLAKESRLTERALRYILHKLEEAGEIAITWNTDRRAVTVGRRSFVPEWFIEVRCVSEWEAYDAEEESAKFSSKAFRRGRPRAVAESEKFAGKSRRKAATKTGKLCSEIGSGVPGNRKNDVPGIYRNDPVSETVTEQEQGSAPLSAPRKTGERTPEENLAVITKLAHEVLDLHALNRDVTERDIVDGIELRCSPHAYAIAVTRDVVYQAIAAAVYQRRRAGKSAVLKNSAGDSAFRMKEAG